MKRRIDLYLSPNTKKEHKWLAKIIAKNTLYLDENLDSFTTYRPDYNKINQIIRMNTVLYIYEEDDAIQNCKYVGRLVSGKLKIGWETLSDAIEDDDFDILEFTEKCKNLYIEEKDSYFDDNIRTTRNIR